MQRNIVIPVLFHHFIISIGATVTDLVADNNNTVVSQRFYVVKKTGEFSLYLLFFGIDIVLK